VEAGDSRPPASPMSDAANAAAGARRSASLRQLDSTMLTYLKEVGVSDGAPPNSPRPWWTRSLKREKSLRACSGRITGGSS
jgi:hypothetical protein